MKLDLDNVFNGLKKTSPALIAVFITSCFVIFAPDFLLEKIGINGLPPFVKQIIGGIFLLSLTLILTIFCFSISKTIKSKRAIRLLEKQIQELTRDELERVLMMYYSPGHALSMSVQDGVTGALKGKRIIYNATNIGDGIGLLTFSFILQPWAVRYIGNHIDEFGISFEEIKDNYEKYIKSLNYLSVL